MTSHSDVDRELHAEADLLLASGLADTLADYASFEPVGSYATGLMTWRDLDVELYPTRLDRPPFYELGSRVAALLRPKRMSFRDETQMGTPGLPCGLYWGIHLGDGSLGPWKLDLWAVEPGHREARRSRDADLRARMTPDRRDAILQIKSAVHSEPGYRKDFTSQDVYAAVLDEGVDTPHQFRKWLRGRGVAV